MPKFKLPFMKSAEPALAVPQMGGRARRGDAAFMSGEIGRAHV